LRRHPDDLAFGGKGGISMTGLAAARRIFCAMGLGASLASSGCYHYHIVADRVPPATEPRTQTEVAYLWGIVQPNDLVPPNCPKNVPLADVTANTNFCYVLLGTVTLGTVLIQDIEWRCAKPAAEDTHVLGSIVARRKKE
jgi:hypothetical protein